MTSKLAFRDTTSTMPLTNPTSVCIGDLFKEFNLIEFFNTLWEYDCGDVPFDTTIYKQDTTYVFELDEDDYLVFDETNSDGTDVHYLSNANINFEYHGITS